MKKIFILLFIIFSLTLTGCQNNNEKNDEYTNNISQNSGDLNSENNEIQTKRISYQEYINKYGDIDNNAQNNSSDYSNSNSSDTSLDSNASNNSTNSNSASNDSESSNIQNNNDSNVQIPANQLATYSTSLQSSSSKRINNIKIVCDRLNNFILKPGQTFSYNNELGPYGPDDGFEKAPILLSNGKKTKGYGGGVCQLSSTLYNVVKNINNVEIIERHHHSKPVSYVPKGQDATVSLQSNLDFKFVNNNNFSIRFEAKCENGKVTVWAFKVI